MCGICGFIGKSRNELDREGILEDMKEAIRHRGPDDGGSWLSADAALGFRRLSIIDLDTGAQPMENETGDKIVVFNGEIYNYQELREELLAAGHVFKTRADTEVLLHGYEQWGEEMLGRLRGMFAFLIWDVRKKEAFGARDFFGIKPFFYTLAAGNLVFASEIKSILKYPEYQPELNEEALEHYLSFQYSGLEESFFKGVYRLDPGCFLRYRVDEGTLDIQRYFEPELQPEKGKSEEDWIREVDDLMKDSVRAHNIADVEIGTFLSGGVDSSMIAAEFEGTRAYTVGFSHEGSRYSEIDFARRTAERCGLSHNGREIQEQEFWEAVPKVLYYMDEPLADPSAVALYFLSKEAAKDVKVVMSGEGSDEFFGGYRIYCEPGSLRGYQRLPKGLRAALAKLALHLPKMKGRQFLIRGSKTIEERFIGNANIFSYEERRQILKHTTDAVSPQDFLAGDYKRTKGMADEDRMQEIDLRRWLPGDILQKADRMSMANSLEVRVPFLDRVLFESARHLPADLKQCKGTTKYVLRQAAKRYLDPETSARPKLGFPIPIRVWMREEKGGYEKIRKVFAGETAGKYFYQDKLLKLLDDHKNGKADNSRKIWTVYAFCVWYDVYFCRQA